MGIHSRARPTISSLLVFFLNSCCSFVDTSVSQCVEYTPPVGQNKVLGDNYKIANGNHFLNYFFPLMVQSQKFLQICKL